MHEISSFKSLAAVLSHGAIVSLTVLLFLSWPVVATSLSASSAAATKQAANWHYVSNVFFNGVACGVGNALHTDPTAVYAAPSYPSFDYSELPGAPSLDFVPGDVPRPETDITGAPRVQGKRADAGAFER